jgi:hypothetical protein
MSADFSKRKFLPKGVVWGVAVLVLIFVISFGLIVYEQSRKVGVSVAGSLNKFQAGVNDLKNFNGGEAEEKFFEASDDLNLNLNDFLSRAGLFIGGMRDLLSVFQDLSNKSAVLAQEVSFFENNLPSLLVDQRGDEIISHLQKVQGILREISLESDKFSSGISNISLFSPEIANLYLPAKMDISRLQNLVDSLLGWLNSDSPRHLLVIFQNPSEIRPAGGFLGSYADVVIDKANLVKFDVHDINDADKKFDLKIIPPKPLQAAVTSWRAADANWFFDFPASAAQVIKFLEASKLYAATSSAAGGNQPVTFDGAVAVSPKVIGDILGIVGPVRIASSSLTLSRDNFLVELQKAVQYGQSKNATYPKNILKEFYSAVVPKLELLGDSESGEFLGLAADWLKKKDLIIYFKDEKLEGALSYYGATGDVYELPQDFEGDYLAVVDANIGGGKSDLYVSSTVTFESQIGLDGIVTDHLVIDRKHEGNKSPYWWYKVRNQDYLQVFLPPQSRLMNFKGGYAKTILPPLNYARNGYAADDFVAQIESSTEEVFGYPAVLKHGEFGKEVFGTWSNVGAGQKTEIVFDYSHRLLAPPAAGTVYQFVFEKQAGTARHYSFAVSAPVGFIFKETNSPAYIYETDDPPARLIVSLTLEEI